MWMLYEEQRDPERVGKGKKGGKKERERAIAGTDSLALFDPC
jgi:hypothetical protein